MRWTSHGSIYCTVTLCQTNWRLIIDYKLKRESIFTSCNTLQWELTWQCRSSQTTSEVLCYYGCQSYTDTQTLLFIRNQFFDVLNLQSTDVAVWTEEVWSEAICMNHQMVSPDMAGGCIPWVLRTTSKLHRCLGKCEGEASMVHQKQEYINAAEQWNSWRAQNHYMLLCSCCQ